MQKRNRASSIVTFLLKSFNFNITKIKSPKGLIYYEFQKGNGPRYHLILCSDSGNIDKCIDRSREILGEEAKILIIYDSKNGAYIDSSPKDARTIPVEQVKDINRRIFTGEVSCSDISDLLP